MAEGGFSRFFDVFTAKPASKNSDRHGRFPIPGEATLELPAGRVRIYFDTTASDLGDDSGFKPPDDLSVTITSEGGDEVPIRFKLSGGVSSKETMGRTRTYVGRIELPEAGRYEVAATQPGGGFPEPHLCLGS